MSFLSKLCNSLPKCPTLACSSPCKSDNSLCKFVKKILSCNCQTPSDKGYLKVRGASFAPPSIASSKPLSKPADQAMADDDLSTELLPSIEQLREMNEIDVDLAVLAKNLKLDEIPDDASNTDLGEDNNI